ncbi:hypothetical protein YC2023_007420 [Brassica napus]
MCTLHMFFRYKQTAPQLHTNKRVHNSIAERASPSDTDSDSDHHNHHNIRSQREMDELRSTTWRSKFGHVIQGEREDELQSN